MEEGLSDNLINLFLQAYPTKSDYSRENVVAIPVNNQDVYEKKQTPTIHPKLQQDIYSIKDTFESITNKVNTLDNKAYFLLH